MPVGPGKYDELANHCFKEAKARGVVLMVLDGEHGNGFSVVGDRSTLAYIPQLLREMADGIERDMRSAGH